MYGCVSLTIKMAEHWRIDAFELWCWRRLLRDPWTAGKSNQTILKEINPEIHWKDWSWSSKTLATRWESLLIGKDPGARKDWGPEEKEATEDEMVRWYHWLNGHEFKQTLGESGGQRSLVCWSPWGCTESDTTKRLNNSEVSVSVLNVLWLFFSSTASESGTGWAWG